ncbi:MAG: PIN domain-containing protein [Actinomycetota bacterium]|nr:PIN domain-containing protein [Actinomycetota bacterium]
MIVVVDTSVYSATLKASMSQVARLYEDDLRRKRPLISFQTVAEIRYGALRDNWGPERWALLEQRLAAATTVPPHGALTIEWAMLRNDCRKAGHAFQDKGHAADLWIAATARLVGAPLVAHDKGFVGVPGLEVICRA